jgi:O-antigen ligase
VTAVHAATRLGAVAAAVLEAGWLAALVVTPITFNAHSFRVFDLDKVALLRSLAVVMAAALIVRALAAAERPGARAWLRSNAVSVLALGGLAAASLSTLTSVAPRISLWGAYERWHGLATLAAYVIVFLSIATLLRTREQAERAVTAVVLVALPVSLYAIVQRAGLDPLAWSGVGAFSRTASTLGNALFLSAFLAMTVPLTVYRLVGAAGAARGSHAGLALAAAYAVTLASQVVALALSRSRGPTLAVAVGLLVLGLAWAAANGRRRLASVLTGLAAAGVLGAAALWLGVVPPPETPSLGRMGRLGDQGLYGRLLFWEGAWQLFASDPVRAVVGWGPETLRLVYPAVTPPGLARLYPGLALDRTHNETFDLLLTTGLVGLGFHVALVLAVVHAGLTALGIIRSSRASLAFAAVSLGTGIVAVALGAAIDRSGRLSGLLLSLGLVIGMGGFVACRAIAAHGERTSPAERPGLPPLLVCALLAGLAAHVLEIQVGIAVESTRLLFWAYAGLLVASTRIAADESGPRGAPSTSPLGMSLPPAMVLVALAGDFGVVGGSHAQLGAVAGLLIVTWLVGGVVVVAQAPSAAAAGRYGAVTLGALLVFFVLGRGLMLFAPAVTSVPILVHGATLLIVGVTAAALAGGGLRRLPRADARAWVVAGVVAALALGAVFFNVRVVQADVVHRQAWLALRDGRHEQAIGLARQAVKTTPWQTAYHLGLGHALIEQARRTGERAAREALFREARDALLRARALSPRDVDALAQLAHLARVWAQLSSDGRERAARFAAASDFFRRATTASPSNAVFWAEWGITERAAGREDSAREKLERARALDPIRYPAPPGR